MDQIIQKKQIEKEIYLNLQYHKKYQNSHLIK